MSEFLEKTNLKNHDRRTVFIRCGCESEILVLDYDPEISMLDLSIYEILKSYEHGMSFWQKVRYIYQIMRYGRPYSDQIVLDKNQIKELKAFLFSISV
jgi:hypothetical protein